MKESNALQDGARGHSPLEVLCRLVLLFCDHTHSAKYILVHRMRCVTLSGGVGEYCWIAEHLDYISQCREREEVQEGDRAATDVVLTRPSC